MKSDRNYLAHIKDCLEAIEEYVAGGRDEFFNNRMVRHATLRDLQTMAEATMRLSQELKDKYSEIPWRSLHGFRNVLVHNYLGIDRDLVWETIETSLPDLKKTVEAMWNELSDK